MTRYLALLVALAVCPACGGDKPEEEKKAEPEKKPEKPKAQKKKKKKGPKLASLSPERPQTKLGDVPISEDLEDEAERSIAIENLESELDRLEAEIVGVE